MNLPPGFRFHPTDEELITHYLAPKVADNSSLSIAVIGELELNKYEPWDLPLTTRIGEEWYFFCIKDSKYPSGLRTNRATKFGYWKATGKDKEIHKRKNLIGMKKTLVFYKGRAPRGEKTNWIMHEYSRLAGNQSKTEKKTWVICRVFYRRSGEKKDMKLVNTGSWFEDEFSSSVLVPSVYDLSINNKAGISSAASNTNYVTCFSDYLVGRKSSEEVTNSYKSPFLPTEGFTRSSLKVPVPQSGSLDTGTASSNFVALHQLFENCGHSIEDNLKIEEVLSISEDIGLITDMQPGALPTVSSYLMQSSLYN